MAGVKTAISLDEKLFEQVNKLAHDLHVSRSKVFVLALQDYLRKQESRSLLAQLNEAYEDYPTENEKEVVETMRETHKKIIEHESW